MSSGWRNPLPVFCCVKPLTIRSTYFPELYPQGCNKQQLTILNDTEHMTSFARYIYHSLKLRIQPYQQQTANLFSQHVRFQLHCSTSDTLQLHGIYFWHPTVALYHPPPLPPFGLDWAGGHWDIQFLNCLVYVPSPDLSFRCVLGFDECVRYICLLIWAVAQVK